MTDFIHKATEFSRDLELNTNHADSAFLLKTAGQFMQEEVDETVDAIVAHDYPEIVDGFGDVAFIALNGIYKTFRSLGEDHTTATAMVDTVMERIANANLAKKQPDGSVDYKNGKVQKPKNWTPPQYNDLIR